MSPNLNPNLIGTQPNFNPSLGLQNNFAVSQPFSPTPVVAQNMQYLFPNQSVPQRSVLLFPPDTSVPPPFINTAQNSAPVQNHVSWNVQTPNYQKVATLAPHLQPRPLNNPFAFDTLRVPIFKSAWIRI